MRKEGGAAGVRVWSHVRFDFKQLLCILYVTALVTTQSAPEIAFGQISSMKTNKPTSTTMTASPTSFNFTAPAGSTASMTQTLAISSPAGGALNWTVYDDSNWVIKNVGEGTGNGTVAVTVLPAGMKPGTHTSMITLTASGASNSPLRIPVTLTLTAAAAPQAASALTVSPTSFSFTAPAGSTASMTQTLAISSPAGGALNWTVVDDSNWVIKNVGGGTGNGTVAVTVQPAGMKAGTHTSMITLTAAGASNSPLQVPVTLTLTAAAQNNTASQPTISLTPASLAFSTTTSGSNPSAQNIAIHNSGTGTLTWSVADNANWLTATQAGTTVTASVNKSGLAAGTYNAAITITASGATNTPQTIPVSLVVTSNQTVNQTAILQWNANKEQNLSGYRVYRATSSGGYGAPVATLQGNVTSFTSSGLQLGTTYFFVITAYDSQGNESGWSNEVSKSIF
ncbi:hypothetical protein W02_12190 [Nitrospira sp. KM1]|uniref:BACON domain-containing protein n=1 Tax=Nitrospira sp. KM1 TaxID=1936990 RepID=UPI0013A746C1|nr:fibronectin type III domain-containing protein [Nitrospira sp. KM1]BCA54079.1 hypothetical protein W02_12190 [Nitrospira sp. KM1]